MKSSDYKCNKCSHVQEISIENKLSFPAEILCEKCHNKSIRVFSNFATICHRGKCGNYKNGYTSSPVSIKKT